jgi:hypothetical protein
MAVTYVVSSHGGLAEEVMVSVSDATEAEEATEGGMA